MDVYDYVDEENGEGRSFIRSADGLAECIEKASGVVLIDMRYFYGSTKNPSHLYLYILFMKSYFKRKITFYNFPYHYFYFTVLSFNPIIFIVTVKTHRYRQNITIRVLI